MTGPVEVPDIGLSDILKVCFLWKFSNRYAQKLPLDLKEKFLHFFLLEMPE